ncbi:MAG: aldo/keto reductase [Proteobacteria bacterium]|nr:aldo/keto reductase [Pseudomonadota bacterium]
MQHRPLGRSGLAIAPLMLGGNVFGWSADEATSFRLLDAFVDAGFNAIDTADSYSRWVPGHSGGESETVIGRWLKTSGKRGKVVIATKVGSDMGQGKCLKKDYILKSADASLKRLGIETIDLYQSHFDDETTPVEETLEAYGQLIKAGKVRAIGASNLSPARLTASFDASRKHGVPRYESLQPKYNLHDRGVYERDYAPIVAAEKIGVIPYYGLAAGFLTGKYRSKDDAEKSKTRGGTVKNYFDARGAAILMALANVARAKSATSAQVALAWLMGRPTITAPIASATKLEQLTDILGAAKLNLSKNEIATLDAASASA